MLCCREVSVLRRGGAMADYHGLSGYDADIGRFMGLSGVFKTVREWQGHGGESILQEFFRGWGM